MRMIVSLISLNVHSVGMESKFYLLSSWTSFVQLSFPMLIFSASLFRHVLSGSYNNYFHIYDRNAETDTVLQADKSAFKAKKIGGNKGAKPGSSAAKGGAKGAAGKPIVDVESIDFNKKILHGKHSRIYIFRFWSSD